jgi:hypothetical protein
MSDFNPNEWGAKIVAAALAIVPEGYVLVPIEPTEAMILAGDHEDQRLTDVTGIYRAMIAAAPKG